MNRKSYQKYIEILVHGYIRENEKTHGLISPYVIIDLCFQFYSEPLVKLQFHKKFRSARVRTTDNNTYASVSEHTMHRFHYLMISKAPPQYLAIHCWRVQVTNPELRWLFIGIGRIKKHSDASYIELKNIVAGISNCNKQYQLFSSKYCETEGFNRKECEIDILLNTINKTMAICVVGDTDNNQVCFQDVVLNTPIVPHFNMGGDLMGLRVLQIPAHLYGKPEFDLFANAQCQ